jgi:hypothetical protein
MELLAQDNEVLEPILFLGQIRQWLRLHKGNFQANVGNNLPFKETFEHA